MDRPSISLILYSKRSFLFTWSLSAGTGNETTKNIGYVWKIVDIFFHSICIVFGLGSYNKIHSQMFWPIPDFRICSLGLSLIASKNKICSSEYRHHFFVVSNWMLVFIAHIKTTCFPIFHVSTSTSPQKLPAKFVLILQENFGIGGWLRSSACLIVFQF